MQHASVTTPKSRRNLQGSFGMIPKGALKLQCSFGTIPKGLCKLQDTFGMIPNGHCKSQDTFGTIPKGHCKSRGGFGTIPKVSCNLREISVVGMKGSCKIAAGFCGYHKGFLQIIGGDGNVCRKDNRHLQPLSSTVIASAARQSRRYTAEIASFLAMTEKVHNDGKGSACNDIINNDFLDNISFKY